MYVKQTHEVVMRMCKIPIELCVQHTNLIVDLSSGEIYRKMKTGNWKKVENKPNHAKGYNVILIDKKQHMRSKIILCANKQINIDQKHINIHHLNGNRLDCRIENLNCVFATNVQTKKKQAS